MRKNVVFSPIANEKLTALLAYLEVKWSLKVKTDFIKKLDKSIDRISAYPQSCPESKQMKGLYKCVVTKQTSLFYRITTNQIPLVLICNRDVKPLPCVKFSE